MNTIFKTDNRNQNGFSFLEVIIAMAILGILAFVTSQTILQGRRQLKGLEDGSIIKYVSSLNATEFMGLDFDNLPDEGTCLSRNYDELGNIISETSQTGISQFSACTSLAFSSDYRMILYIKPLASLGVTYSNTFLKLPTFYQDVKLLQIITQERPSTGKLIKKPTIIDLFRRK